MHGGSTRTIDRLIKALGTGFAGGGLADLRQLDTAVAAFRTGRSLGEDRYLWVDATYRNVRVDGGAIRRATSASGSRATVGCSASMWAL